MGYLYACDTFVKYLRNTQSAMDGQTPLLNQLIIANTLQAIDYEAHIDAICRLYGQRCQLFNEHVVAVRPSICTLDSP